MLSLVLTIVFLPESHPVGEQSKEKEAIIDFRAWRGAIFNPIGTLFILTFISTCGFMIFANVFGLYGLEKFGFGPEDVGVMMVLGLVSALAQGALAGPLTKKLGDELVIKVGLFATPIGFGLMLLASAYVTILLATAFFALTVALQVPALTSLTSRRATVLQGIAMGLSNSFISLGRIVGPLLGGYIYDINILLLYISGAAIMVIAFIVSIITLKGVMVEFAEAKYR